MFNWIAFASIGVILLGLQLANGYLTQVIASKNHDNTTFLISEYKARPSATTTTIKAKTALCVTEKVKQNIPALNKLFGELVLYTVKNIEKDQSTFYQGLLAMMSKQERSMYALVEESSPAKEKAIRAMMSEFQEKPLNLLSCVANKMKKPVAT